MKYHVYLLFSVGILHYLVQLRLVKSTKCIVSTNIFLLLFGKCLTAHALKVEKSIHPCLSVFNYTHNSDILVGAEYL